MLSQEQGLLVGGRHGPFWAQGSIPGATQVEVRFQMPTKRGTNIPEDLFLQISPKQATLPIKEAPPFTSKPAPVWLLPHSS